MEKEQLKQLSARLPELEWKLNTLGVLFNPKKLPAGLFTHCFEMTAQSCISELKSDLLAVQKQTNERSARYIANRIEQKINVLVRMCKLNNTKPTERVASFGVQAINTRQQWLHSLEQTIDTLNEQYKALEKAQKALQQQQKVQAVLNLQAEMGDLGRRLTLAKETLARSVQI